MSQTNPVARQGDPSIRWLVGGTLVMAAGLLGFLMYLADEVRFVGPTGAGAILGMGVAACVAFGALTFGPIGRAVAKRILEAGALRAAVEDDLHELRLQVDDLRNALAESQERIDFTERLLAGGKDRVAEELH